ncbi:hypothetical protein COO60DRAFT_1652194 [Scenedesmus sp. NREL 46B-D3]|nr:hypothetical protein COO60DRAFT_1652194 [Scenedesmus sp. NREL 46B-D3]
MLTAAAAASSPASPKTPSATETQPSGSGAVPLAAASPTAPSLPPGDGQAAAPQDAFCGQLTASGKTMLVYSSAVQEAGNWRGMDLHGSSSSSSNNNVTPKNAFCGQMTASGKTMLVYNTAAQHAGSWRDACTCTVYLPSGGAL